MEFSANLSLGRINSDLEIEDILNLAAIDDLIWQICSKMFGIFERKFSGINLNYTYINGIEEVLKFQNKRTAYITIQGRA